MSFENVRPRHRVSAPQAVEETLNFRSTNLIVPRIPFRPRTPTYSLGVANVSPRTPISDVRPGISVTPTRPATFETNTSVTLRPHIPITQQVSYPSPTTSFGGSQHGNLRPHVPITPQVSHPSPTMSPGGFQIGGLRPRIPITPQVSHNLPTTASGSYKYGGNVKKGVLDPATKQSGVPSSGPRGAHGKRLPEPDLLFTRPETCVTKIGQTGRHVTVDTNYFKLLKKPEWNIHQYRVDFIPEIDLSFVRRTLIGQHKSKLGGYIFDGSMLFTTIDLKAERKCDGRYIEYFSEYNNGDKVKIKIKHVGVVDSNETQVFQVLNLILRQSMDGLDLQQIARHFFDPYAKVNVNKFHVEIWPGYITSIRQHERDILLCTEITHRIMRTDTLYTSLCQLTSETKDYQKLFKSQVIGSVVLTEYNNKTYTITDVDFNSSPLSEFSFKNKKISFAEYFNSRYNLIVTDISQPMLISKPTNKHIRGGQEEYISLIPEFTRATGISDEMRTNFSFMKSMSDHTRLNPEMRLKRLRDFNKRLTSSKKSIEVLNQWNMKLENDVLKIPARILPHEKILLGRGVIYQCDDNSNWTREFRKRSMFTNAIVSRWHVIVPSRCIREAQVFVQMCMTVAKNMNMELATPNYVEIVDDRNSSYTGAIENTASQDPQILMIVIQQPNEEKYSMIKKKCCVDRPVASQVVTMKMIAPSSEKSAGLMSIATKVVIQMNAKLRGIPWMIDIPVKGLMTIGFDVCHSSKDKNISYSALVATMDVRHSSKYFSAVRKHEKFQELSNDIIIHFTFALRAYRDEHGSLPERILFYRDGVGDGQLLQVVNNELKHLLTKAKEIYVSTGKPENELRLTFIVVSKRLNTRYFFNNNNPPPGTIVDEIITLPERYDFFLVSQNVRQGTVSPTSYNVIYDTMGLSPDRVQMLTYKMTHMYFNYTGTCRVPAVCQYAHKLAYFVAESIHCAPSKFHDRNLYFL